MGAVANACLDADGPMPANPGDRRIGYPPATRIALLEAGRQATVLSLAVQASGHVPAWWQETGRLSAALWRYR